MFVRTEEGATYSHELWFYVVKIPSSMLISWCVIFILLKERLGLLHWPAEGSPSRKLNLDWPQTGLDVNALIKEVAIKCLKQWSGIYSNESWFVTKEPEVLRL